MKTSERETESASVLRRNRCANLCLYNLPLYIHCVPHWSFHLLCATRERLANAQAKRRRPVCWQDAWNSRRLFLSPHCVQTGDWCGRCRRNGPRSRWLTTRYNCLNSTQRTRLTVARPDSQAGDIHVPGHFHQCSEIRAAGMLM